MIIYDKVLLEVGKNKTQNYGEEFVYHLNSRYTFVWVSIKQELVHGVEGVVINGGVKDFPDTNLRPDYL